MSSHQITSPTGPLLNGAASEPLAADLKLQILATEHWSLLSTRALTWNEAFSRATTFLSALSGAVVALALVASGTAFGNGFVTFALLLLPVLLFAGIGTFVRLTQINGEDVQWVIGMNRLRRAYLEAAPDLEPYFITGSHDDEAGIMATFAAVPGPGGYRHEFVTMPGLIAVIDGVLAAAIAAIVAFQLGASLPVAVLLAIAAAILAVVLLTVHQYRRVVQPRGRTRPRFPDGQARSSARNRYPRPRSVRM
jgi:hypothetical protein